MANQIILIKFTENYSEFGAGETLIRTTNAYIFFGAKELHIMGNFPPRHYPRTAIKSFHASSIEEENNAPSC